MSTQYGIIYGEDGSPDYDLDAPYSTPEDALDGYDPERCEEMGGAALLEVSECTVDHVDLDWEPGAEVSDLSPVGKRDIEKAVEADMTWLTGEAQNSDDWKGTTPADVGPLDLGDQTAITLTLAQIEHNARHDALLGYAEECWERKAKGWSSEGVA